MKKKFLLPVMLLAAMTLVGCGGGKSSETSTSTSSGTSSSSSSEVIQYGVAIANKEALTAEWHVKENARELDIALTPEGNVMQELTNGNLTIASSNTEAVTVTGVNLNAVGEGEATITVTYHDKTDTVTITVQAEKGEPDHVKATVKEMLAAVADGKEKNVIYDIEAYVVDWQSGKTDPTKYGNYMLGDTKDAAKADQILVYGSSANEAFTITWGGEEYSYSQPDEAKDFLTNEITKDVAIGSKLTMEVIAYSYSGTPEVSGRVLKVDNSEVVPVDIPEPAVQATTLAGFIADTQGNGKQAFTFSAEVKYYKSSSATEADKYGNLVLTDGENDLVVYGSTATASALAWSNTSGIYGFTNPKDFLTNETTKDIQLGDTVSVKFIRADFQGTVQGTGIITSVTPGAVIDPTAVELDADSFNLEQGASKLVKATLSPEGAKGTVEWAVSPADKGVTVVDGLVAAAADATLGDYTVTATVKDTTLSDSVAVTVIAATPKEYTKLEKLDFTSTLTAYEAYDEAKMNAFLLGSSELGASTNLVNHSIDNPATKPLIGANGGSGDAAWSNYNLLKLGSGSKASNITLNFKEGVTIGKVELKAFGWAGLEPTLKVGDASAQAVAAVAHADVKAGIETGACYSDYTFTFSGTNQVRLDASLAVMISEITVYTVA